MCETASAVANTGTQEEEFLPIRLTVRLVLGDTIFLLEVIQRDGRAPTKSCDIFSSTLALFERAANGDEHWESGDFKTYLLFYEALVGQSPASFAAKKAAVSGIIRWCMDILKQLTSTQLPSPADHGVLLATLRDIRQYAEERAPPGDQEIVTHG